MGSFYLVNEYLLHVFFRHSHVNIKQSNTNGHIRFTNDLVDRYFLIIFSTVKDCLDINVLLLPAYHIKYALERKYGVYNITVWILVRSQFFDI